MVDQRELTIDYIRINGPVLPVQIAKHINTNILFSSAILSELVERKMLKITSAAVGGSPLYYLPGQEAQMDERLQKSISGKEKEAYQLLKENKVLREKNLEPWQRVAVRSLKDFSRQINVTVDGTEETFWKHHLVTEEELKQIISGILEQEKPKEIIPEPQLISNPAELPKQEIKVEQMPQKIIQEETLPVQQTLEKIKIQHKPEGKFYEKIKTYLQENNIYIIKEETTKKDKEFDFLVDINTPLGKLRYLIKAKSKASITEADITKSHSEGQIKNMPVIVLTNGKISKKTQTYIDTKLAGQLNIKQL